MATKISLVNGKYYTTSVTTNADGSLKATTFRTDASGGGGVAVSTVNTSANGTSTRTPESGATPAETAAFNNPSSPERQAYTAQVLSQNPYGANPTAAQTQRINATAGRQNTATTDPNASGQPQGGSTTTAAGAAAAAGEASEYKANTRVSYADSLKYPEGLDSATQDVIKFSILQYSPSLAKGNQGKPRIVTLPSGTPIVAGSKRIGVITLPIPAGISDGNNVGWQNDTLSELQEVAVKAADALFGGNVEEAAGGAVGRGEETFKSGEAGTALKSIFGSAAAAGANVAARAYGAQFNNNLELLFSTPNLRSFSFQFSFYPRSKEEAVMIRRIIRAFKQSMSVKRSKTALLLKAPHTFAICYVMAGGKPQPYLNRFKECALTSCNVDYTPDNTYMTYGGPSDDDKSMTAYRLSLTFQELEPIFDDEYFDIDENKDSSIGF
jgi:hypothetical protein